MKIRKIGIDARLYFQTGVGTYVRNLLYYLSLSSPNSMQFYVYVLPKDVPTIHLPPGRFTIRPVDAPWHSVREQTVFYSAIMEDTLDLMHFTYFSYPIRYMRPFIATVHDVTPLLFKTGRASTLSPLWYEIKHQIFTFVLSSQIKHARTIITPTKSVKDQIVTMYGSSISNKIYPLYEGVSYELMAAKENTSLSKKYPKPFYLYVGNFYPHKNIERLIEAFRKMLKQVQHDNPPDLLLVGPDTMFAQKLKDHIAAQNIRNITFNHNATIEDLVFFYNHAKALINPSLSEGFGLPLIEAAYFGCPVIASNIPVFRELLGSNYTSFDAMNVEDIASKLKESSSVIPSEVKTKSRNFLLEKFNFEKMTRELIEIYSKTS